MPNKVQVSILFVLLCIGCDMAAKQQQAEETRRAATVAELKQLGEEMHDKRNKESSPAGTPNDATQGPDESTQHESVPESTASSPNAVDGSPNSPMPTE